MEIKINLSNVELIAKSSYKIHQSCFNLFMNDDNNDMFRIFDISFEIYNTKSDDCTVIRPIRQERNTTNRLSDIAIVKY